MVMPLRVFEALMSVTGRERSIRTRKTSVRNQDLADLARSPSTGCCRPVAVLR